MLSQFYMEGPESTPLEPMETKIYPNPNSADKLFVDLWLPQATSLNVRLYNSTGQLVRSLENTNLRMQGAHFLDYDLSGLGNGLYFLIIRSDQETVSQQIVVSR